jgi:hypothetical protein
MGKHKGPFHPSTVLGIAVFLIVVGLCLLWVMVREGDALVNFLEWLF